MGIYIIAFLTMMSLILFDRYLVKGKKLFLMFSISAAVVSLLILLTFTDTLYDTMMVTTFICSSFLLMSIPCFMLKKNMKGYEIVFIVTHMIAILLLTGIRFHLLIQSPPFYLILILFYSIIYLIRRSADWVRIGLILSVLLILSVTNKYKLNQNYMPEKTSNYRYFETLSKPTIIAIEKLKKEEKYTSLYTTFTMKKDDHILVVIQLKENINKKILKDEKYKDVFVLTYKDGEVKEIK